MTTPRENIRTAIATIAAEIGATAAGDTPEYRAARAAELKALTEALSTIEVYETSGASDDPPGSFEIVVQGVS